MSLWGTTAKSTRSVNLRRRLEHDSTVEDWDTEVPQQSPPGLLLSVDSWSMTAHAEDWDAEPPPLSGDTWGWDDCASLAFWFKLAATRAVEGGAAISRQPVSVQEFLAQVSSGSSLCAQPDSSSSEKIICLFFSFLRGRGSSLLRILLSWDTAWKIPLLFSCRQGPWHMPWSALDHPWPTSPLHQQKCHVQALVGARLWLNTKGEEEEENGCLGTMLVPPKRDKLPTFSSRKQSAEASERRS